MMILYASSTNILTDGGKAAVVGTYFSLARLTGLTGLVGHNGALNC